MSRPHALVPVVVALVIGLLAVPAAAETYTVRRGDTLSHIANRHRVPVDALAAANGISDRDHVRFGTVLDIPSPTAVVVVRPSLAHVVARGENLTTIARRYGVTVGALVAENAITNPNRVVAGRALRIPSGGSDATAFTLGAEVLARLPDRLRAVPERLAYWPLFDKWSAEYGVAPDLVRAVTWQESGWQQDKVSSKGAIGIGQLMPTTASWVASSLIGAPLDPSVVEDNIRMSARYLAHLVRQTGGDERLAAAGYYQGLRSVQTRGMYLDTVQYLDAVAALRARFAS